MIQHVRGRFKGAVSRVVPSFVAVLKPENVALLKKGQIPQPPVKSPAAN